MTIQKKTSTFNLPGRLTAKVDPALIGADEQHFADIAEGLEQTITGISGRLAEAPKARGGSGQMALERDLEIHRLTGRLRALRRFGLDLCLGRRVSTEHPEPVYIGRLGLTDPTGRQPLVDWRSPAAAPFFGATHAHPMGLTSRRRYRWIAGRISDFWDEVFTSKGSSSMQPSTTSPPSSPASAPVGRAGCVMCSAPSRLTRTPSSAPGPGGHSSSTAGRALLRAAAHRRDAGRDAAGPGLAQRG